MLASTQPELHRTELRESVSVTATRTRLDWTMRTSVDRLVVERDVHGRVRASRRVPDPARSGVATTDLVRCELSELSALSARSDTRTDGGRTVVQSARSVDRPVPYLLVRAESEAGPVLAGAASTEHPGRVCARTLHEVGDMLSGGPAAVGDCWSHRPVLLAPRVAATVVLGAYLALSSPSAVRLDGRRMLPHGMTLTDLPLHPGGHDDSGASDLPVEYVRQGRVTLPGRDEATGVVRGRAEWHHDLGRLVPRRTSLLELSGTPAPVPPEAIVVGATVEGLRSFRPGGSMTFVGLAREPGSSGWHRVEVTAAPLVLLRLSTGLAGPAQTSFAGSQITTPGLLLPAATGLERADAATSGSNRARRRNHVVIKCL